MSGNLDEILFAMKHDIKFNYIPKIYFIKQAKLIYNIENDNFYNILYNDFINEGLKFDESFKSSQASIWIIQYELKKLKEIIIKNNIDGNKYVQQMSKSDINFCKLFYFLPSKRIKNLWMILKQHILNVN